MKHPQRHRPLSDTTWGILVGLAVTLLVNLPQWISLLTTDEALRSDVVTESSDEEFYLTRIQEVANGHPWAGHPYLLDRADQKYPIGSLFEVLQGTFMRTFHISIKTVSILGDLLFPFLLAFTLWMTTASVLHEKRWRVLIVSILFLGFELVWWKRPISPQATMLLPLLWMWSILSEKRSSVKHTVMRGGLIGLMLYSYPFHWTYCLAAEGLFMLGLLMKDQTWTERGKRIAAIGVPIFMVGLPWLLMILSLQGNVDYTRTLERLGFIERHFPAGLPLQALLITSGLLVFWARRRSIEKSTANTLLVLLLGGLAVLNQPLITGREGEFSSHYRVILLFPLWISLLWAVRSIVGIRWHLTLFIPTLGLLFIGYRTIEQTRIEWAAYEAKRTNPTRTEEMALMSTLDILPGQHVILTDDRLGRLLTVYTEHYPFYVFETHMYMVDDETLWDRIAVQENLFPDHQYSPRAIVGSSYLNKALHMRTLCIVQSIIKRTKENCAVHAESLLPDRWRSLDAFLVPIESIKTLLKDAHVRYALMKNPPRWLVDESMAQSKVNDYTLLRFDWSTVLPNPR